MNGRHLGPWLLPIALRAGPIYRRTLGRRVRVVAVVGSVGKTTTMRTVSAALGVRVHRPALLNQNSPAGVSRALLSMRPWQRHAVVEAGIVGPGQMRHHAARMRPDIVVVTAIARDHWQSLPTIEITREEKADMVRALPSTAVAVLNADDPNVRWMATQTRARVVLVGEAEDADVRATEVELEWPRGMRFTAHLGAAVYQVRVQLLGRHMVFPALAAIAVAHIEALPLDSVVAALASVEPTPGRMQTLVLASGAVVIRDDFKGTVDAFDAAMDTLAGTPARRRIAVLGGISETTGRQDYRTAGQRVGALVDRAIFVGTSTEAQLYRSGAVSAGLSPHRIDHVHHANEAVELLRDELTDGDVVLIRGRWQQALGRVGLALAGQDVQCRADPCPMKRMLCDICPMLDQPFMG
jgi:UDP-N-acetylmuramoyl-tripeptide--D-alanyl-D-alanine ligase